MAVEVTYLDPTTVDRDIFCSSCEELFKRAGFSANVTPVSNATRVRDAIEASRCDVLVCDLSLEQVTPTGNWGGLAVIDEIKRDYPYIFTIGTTGGYPRYNAIDVWKHSFDLFIPKYALKHLRVSDPNYVSRLQARFRQLPPIDVTIDGTVWPPSDRDPPSATEIQILVRQLFSSTGQVVLASSPSEVVLVPLGDGRSGSFVFTMQGKNPSTGRNYLRSVVKISELGDFDLEYERYHKYIKWSLPYNSRVDILGTGVTRKWGAIAYSFAHGTKPVTTLTALLKAGALDECVAAINQVFESARAFWGYVSSVPLTPEEEDRYFLRYFRNVAGYEWHNNEMAHNFEVAGYSVALDRSLIQINGMEYPNVIRKLLEGDTKFKGGWSICHGDMNTNNILVSEGADIAFIDFRDSEIGHVFEDMVTLEGCVRLHWQWGDNGGGSPPLKSLIEREKEVNASRRVRSPDHGWDLIRLIRKTAFEMFPKEQKESYLFGLAYYCLRLLRLRNLSPQAVSRLLAATLACAESI